MLWLKPITHKEVIFIEREGQICLRWLARVWVFCGFDVCQHRYVFKVLWGLRNKIHQGEIAYDKEFRILWKGWPIQIDYFN